MDSLLQSQKKCYICGETNVECHHIFFGNPNRKNSEKYGMKVWLCPEHHRGNASPHQMRSIDLMLKRMGQIEFERHWTREEFVNIFGRNYIGVSDEHIR